MNRCRPLACSATGGRLGRWHTLSAPLAILFLHARRNKPVEHPKDWTWCSCPYYAKGEEDSCGSMRARRSDPERRIPHPQVKGCATRREHYGLRGLPRGDSFERRTIAGKPYVEEALRFPITPYRRNAVLRGRYPSRQPRRRKLLLENPLAAIRSSGGRKVRNGRIARMQKQLMSPSRRKVRVPN